MTRHSEPCDLVVVGSVNMDLVMRLPSLPTPGTSTLGGTFQSFPGGKGANQAAASARLGARVSLVGCVGDDEYGPALREAIEDSGVDATHLHRLPDSRSGIAIIAVDSRTGENMIAVASGANDAVDDAFVHRHAARLQHADGVLLQSEIPVDGNIAAASIARAHGATVILNAAPAGRLPDALLTRVDVLLVNEHEGAALCDCPPDAEPVRLAAAVFRRVAASGVGAVVVTVGPRGCAVADADGPPRHHEAFAVEAVDTVGAGDAFVGAFTRRILGGDALDRAARAGNAAGALAASRPGALPSIPTAAEVEALAAGV